jgi:hypothetical protein
MAKDPAVMAPYLLHLFLIEELVPHRFFQVILASLSISWQMKSMR